MTDRRAVLRRLVLERRDVQADLAEARLRIIDAEAAGMDVTVMQAHVAELESRDRELDYAQRQLSAEIAAAEAEMAMQSNTVLGSG